MRAFLNSPAEGSRPLAGTTGVGQHMPWGRVVQVIVAIAVVAGVIVALAMH